MDLSTLHNRLNQHQAKNVPGQRWMRQAAVAMTFRERTVTESALPQLELLFIRRSENPNDPWSGHMAFPGGKVDPEDASAKAAALRECREEIDLDLEKHGLYMGRLSHVLAKSKRKIKPMVVTPFLFHLREETTFQINEEVSETIWIPLSFFLNANNRSTMDYKVAKINMKLPCYRFEGRLVWGLSLRMLDELIDIIKI